MKTETENTALVDGMEREDEDTLHSLFLTFSIADQSYGMETRYVSEIVGMQEITAVPEAPRFVRGVVNLRGNVIPIVDVRLRFGMEEKEYDERTCIIVTTVGEIIVGLVVDQVSEVISIDEECISPPPKVAEDQGGAEYIQGMGRLEDEVSILLDVRKLLGEGAEA